jgi:hypothetical protein
MSSGGSWKVAGDRDHGVAVRLEQCVVPGPHMTEVPRVQDHLHVLVLGGELAQDDRGAVLRRVVDENVLVAVLRQLRKDRPHRLVHLPNVPFFVETRGHDRDQAHGQEHNADGGVAQLEEWRQASRAELRMRGEFESEG